MKKNLDHLPGAKRKEIGNIVSAIRKKCNDVEMIILFGSYARGDYKVKDDLSPDRKSGHISDYDVLVVTRYKDTVDNSDLWDELSKACNGLKPSAYIRLIAHDIQEVNIKLAEGRYFFSDIKKEGCMLYDAGNFALADERELTPDERQRMPWDHFEHWFERARRFYRHYKIDFEEGDFKGAAFQLHQTVEASYKSVLLVTTNYNPNEHWPAALSEMVVEQDASFSGIFPLQTRAEKDRFALLDYAYIGARYDPNYRISKENIRRLADSVQNLIALTETVCRQKIQSIGQR